MVACGRRQPLVEGRKPRGVGASSPHKGPGDERGASLDALGDDARASLWAYVRVEYSCGGVPSLLLVSLEARLEPIAVAGDVENVHVVGEAIE